MSNLDEGIAFVRALGIEVEFVEPDGNCAAFNEASRVMTLCRDICPGRQARVLDRMLALA